MELLKKAGLNPEKVESIDYSGRRSPEQDATLISEGQRKRLWAIAKSKGVGEDAIKQKFGLASFNEIKRGDYDHIVKWVEDGAKPESPVGPAETATPSPSAASEAPAGDVPPEVDQQGLEAEARAREQAEAAAEHDPPRPTGRVDRQAVWEALLRKAKEMKVSAPTGLLKSLTGGKTSLASMDDAEVLALAKKLQ